VAENGAILYKPDAREQRLLADPPPQRFVSRLQELGIQPLVLGHVIVATTVFNESKVCQVIKELNLELDIIHNKRNIMILPTGVTKGTGLRAALEELALSPLHCVAVGDAENDLAMLEVCGLGVAVANALPVIKRRAKFVTVGARGTGVAELVDWLLVADQL
jgi:hypothetical protein